MTLLKSVFAIALFSSHVAIAGEVPSVSINNLLANCSEITNTKILNDGNMPVLSFDLILKDSIGDCGCKSALGSFMVNATREDYRSFLMAGKINFLNDGKKYLPLATDSKLIGSSTIEIQFGCASPD